MDGNAGVTNASANDSEDADIAATPMIINMVRDVINVAMSIFAFDSVFVSSRFLMLIEIVDVMTSCRQYSTLLYSNSRQVRICNDIIISYTKLPMTKIFKKKTY